MIRKHYYQKGSYLFIFLKFMTNWWMKMHLKMTLYHKLPIAEIFFIEETKGNKDRGTTKFKVTSDKMVSFLSTTGQYSRRQTHLKR